MTDGEFCSLRSQGDNRPLHIWQLIHDAKEAVKRMSQKTLENMLFATHLDEGGLPVVPVPHPAIPLALIQAVFLMQQVYHSSREECVSHFRQHLVPEGYAPYPFRRKHS